MNASNIRLPYQESYAQHALLSATSNNELRWREFDVASDYMYTEKQ